MALRAVHISDTHLGFGTYNRIDPETGINQREMDFYGAFEKTIDETLTIQPDFVVHSGDLFDTVRPQNRAIDVALRQLVRLSDAGIETILISGNHSTPRLKETGNIFTIFEHLEHVHPVYEAGVSRVPVGDTLVHAVPHSTNPSLDEVLAEAEPSPDFGRNVLVLHAGIKESGYKMDEFNEQAVPQELLSDEFDYIALGHFHKFSAVSANAFYSGSTERHSFSELGQPKGFVEVDLESRKVNFHEIPVREMVELEEIDASGLDAQGISSATRQTVEGAEIGDRIARLVVRNVSPLAAKTLDVASLRRLGSEAMHFELKIDRVAGSDSEPVTDVRIGSLAQEYQRYIDGLQFDQQRKEQLLRMGIVYFTEEGS